MPRLDLLDHVLYGATLMQWLLAGATLGGVYVALSVLRRVFTRRVGEWAGRTAVRWDDVAIEVVRRTRQYFLFALAFQAAMRVVVPDPRVAIVLNGITVVIVLLQIGVWGNGLIGVGATHYALQRAPNDIGARATIQAMGYAARAGLWTLLFVTGLDHFGIEVTALVAGLGITGIAVALAVQNILGDLFAALAIVLDKPFVVGDFIIVDTMLGSVEHIGLKTTRLRSLSGEQIIVSNNELLKSRIRNYKRMERRRAVFTVDVSQETPADLVERVPALIRDIVEKQPLVQFDRSHFLTFADAALRIESVYWVMDADFNKYADIQHAINVQLLRRFHAEGIGLAVPPRAIHIRRETDLAPSPS